MVLSSKGGTHMRILVCEDEKNLNRLITKKLEMEGYAVDSCFDGEEGLFYIEDTEYDLIILDIMMPIRNGYEVLKETRKQGKETPVLFLTAKDSTEDIVTGLDMGANDYVVKPFTFEELLARVRMLLRTKPKGKQPTINIMDMEINTTTRQVKRSGQDIPLTTKEYAVLEYMVYNQGVVLTKEQIESHIWSYDAEIGTNLVKVYIRYLRKKLDDPYERKLIHTVRGTGYVLKGEDDECES